MPITEPLEQLWRGLEESATHRAEGWVRRLANPGLGIPTHVALRSNGGARSLMIDIPLAASGGLRDLPVTAGLSVTLQAVSGIPGDHRALVVELEDRSFADLFAVFCTDLVEGLSVCSKVSDAIVLLLERLARWQRFLSVALTGLDRSALVGLFGELVFLRDILVPLGGVGILSAWTGAQRLPQDFIVPGLCAVEVKTTEASALHSVYIHGERQLDDSGLDCLFLACLRLEADAEKGESLNNVVRQIRSMAGSIPEFSALFERQLAAANYFDRHIERYEEFHFRIAEMRFFRVGNGLPRLTGESLPVGIDDVRYRLSLQSCTSRECSKAELQATLGRLDLRLQRDHDPE